MVKPLQFDMPFHPVYKSQRERNPSVFLVSLRVKYLKGLQQ